MKIKKNSFSTLVLELFFPSIANCRKLKLQNRLPLIYTVRNALLEMVMEILALVGNLPRGGCFVQSMGKKVP
jgi:hypothetical protein